MLTTFSRKKTGPSLCERLCEAALERPQGAAGRDGSRGRLRGSAVGDTMDLVRSEPVPFDGPEGFEARCQQKGLRMTDQRRVIARTLFDAGDHPDAEDLHERVRREDPSISIATIYRTLQIFESLDIIAKRDFGDGRARFEISMGQRDHHHHLIDIESGEVIEFYNQELEDLKVRIADELGFDLLDHHLELFGTRIPSDTEGGRS